MRRRADEGIRPYRSRATFRGFAGGAEPRPYGGCCFLHRVSDGMRAEQSPAPTVFRGGFRVKAGEHGSPLRLGRFGKSGGNPYTVPVVADKIAI